MMPRTIDALSVRRDATELGDARRRVEQLVCEFAGRREGGFASITSVEAWQARGQPPDEDPLTYHEHWLAALETVLSGSGLLSDADVDAGTRAAVESPPNGDQRKAIAEPVAIDRARPGNHRKEEP